MKTVALLVILVIVSMGLSACGTSPTEPAADTDGIRGLSVGVVLPLTGPLAATGQLMKQGFDLAHDEINAAHPSRTHLTFFVEDDSSTGSVWTTQE